MPYGTTGHHTQQPASAQRRPKHKPTYRTQEYHAPYVPPHRPNQEFRRPRETRAVLTLDSLVSTQEILATKHQLHLPQPAPLVGIPKIARDSVRIRQVESSGEGCKAKGKRGTTEQRFAESKMNVPITFPPVLARDPSEEALVVEGEIERYLVRRIHINERASVEIMFKQCFNMLHPSIWARLDRKTQKLQYQIFGEAGPNQLGKIELDVCFGGSRLCRRAIMKFAIIPAPSLYNIILGHLGLKHLRAIPSTIHGMIKFSTP
ncbi:hypothetical protein Tco_0673375 [Tanacetum coccineum]